MSRKRAVPETSASQSPRWVIAAVTAALLVVVSWLDYATGPRTSFTLLYLVPIAVATLGVGRRAGLLTSACAAMAALLIALEWPTSLAAECWNTGARFGVFMIFCTLLDRPRPQEQAGQIVTRSARLLAAGAASGCVLAGVGWAVGHSWPSAGEVPLINLLRSPSRVESGDLAARIERALRASRPVLLGSRNPAGPSCVTPVKSGDIKDMLPPIAMDLNGGPGTTIATLYMNDRGNNTTAMRDFEWHQTRLKSYLENELALNQPATSAARELSEAASRFAEDVRGWSAIPDDVVAIGYVRRDNWPSYCMAEIDRAISEKVPGNVVHWANELASACFSLEDIHRWMALACENHLAALAFQKQCQALFEWADKRIPKYDLGGQISTFPAGIASLNGWGNYAEIERQGERMFSMPPDRLSEVQRNEHLTAGSVWVAPAARAGYLRLRAALSSSNQTTWDAAARTPYEHSYLTSMLYRAQASDALESVAKVLGRFDAGHPHASVGEIMSVLMYRGHSFGGMEWSDRYQPELLSEAGQIPVVASDEAAFMVACHLTHQHSRGPLSYASTATLRDALQQRKLDCVRATDMIGAIFRNAGGIGFAHVRWSAGTAGHSVAAHVRAVDGVPRIVVADGLAPQEAPEKWPDCYFQGHAWPAGMEANPPPYSVELYVRGLDTYLWAQGYIVRGPRAGWLTTARVPYSSCLCEPSTKQVYFGPFPE